MPSSSSAPDSSAAPSSPTVPAWGREWMRSAPSNGNARVLRTSALESAKTPSALRSIMLGALAVLVLLGGALLFVPWRQTVSGTGEVTAAFRPGR